MKRVEFNGTYPVVDSLRATTAALPEIVLEGNTVNIADGDSTPATADHTDFGGTPTLGGTVTRSFTVRNTGTGALNLTSTPKVTVGGANASDFTVSIQPGSPVASGGTTTFQVTFDPSVNGLRSATLSLVNDDPDENPFDFAIQGTGLNLAPVAEDDTYSIAEDIVLIVAAPGVLDNDSDPESAALTATVDIPPEHGALTLHTDGSFTYTPVANYHGGDSFTYTVSDPVGLTATATVTLTVTPVNDRPFAKPLTIQVAEDGSVAVVLKATDGLGNPLGETDTDGDPLTFAILASPSLGSFSGTPPNLVYTPAPNFHGTEYLSYNVSDGIVTSSPAGVTLVVTPVNDAPVAVDDNYALGEDMIASAGTPAIGVLKNDSDADGDTLTAILVSNPSHGTVMLQSDGRFTYTPPANFNGPDTWTYKVNDGTTDSGIATVTFTVNPANDLPVISSQHLSTPEDMPLAVVLNASDVDGDTVALSVISAPAHGTVSGTPPNLTYTPAANYHGSDVFGYLANDGHGGLVSATIYITVTPVNDAPVAVDDSYALGEDMIASAGTPAIGVLKNDSDADGDTLTATLVSNPAHGTVTLQPDGRFIYTPPANFNGPDTWTYKLNDGTMDSSVATVTFTVNPANDLPVASAQSLTTAEDTLATITLTASDVDGDALTYTITSNPARGTLTGTAPNLSYRPWPHYHGPDQFTFQVSDGVATASATVTITVTPVNDVPVAGWTGVTTPEDTAGGLTLSAADVEAMGYSVLQVFGSDATAGRSPSGGLIEGADQKLYGTTEFGGAGDNGTVFRVNPDGSGYTVLHSFAANRSQGAWPRARLAAGPDGVLFGTTATGGNSNAGTVWKLNADGSGFTVLLHKAGFPGSSTGLLLGSDGALYGTTVFGGASNNGTVFKLGTDGSGFAVLHSFSGLVNEGGRPYAQLVEDAAGVLYGTTEVGGADAVNGGTVFKIQKNGTGFTLLQAFAGGTGNAGTLRRGLLLASDGALYGVTPTGGQNAKGTVFKMQRNGTGFQLLHQFAANGTQGGIPQAALVEDVDGVLYGATTSFGASFGGTLFRLNKDGTGFGVLHHFRSGTGDGNQAQGELVAASGGSLFGVTQSGTATSGGALFRLARAESGLTYTVGTSPAHGTLSGDAPNLTYTPAANYHGTDTFTFTVNDGTADSADATVTITVNPANDLPIISSQHLSTPEDVPLAVVLSASDVDGDTVTLSVISTPAHGTVSGTPPNLTYTPAANYHGSDVFGYLANDGRGGLVSATIYITVTPVNDAPVAVDDSYALGEDMIASAGTPAIGVLKNDSDADGDTLTATLVSDPAYGTVTLQPDGRFIYTPPANFNGRDTWTYKLNDGTMDSSVAAVTFTVNPANDLPVISSQHLSTPEDVPLAVVLSASDVDGDTVALSVISAPAHGTVSGTPPNLTYTPAANYHGSDVFGYLANDGHGGQLSATIYITVTPVNDAPVDRDRTLGVLEDNGGGQVQPQVDADGEAVTYFVVTPPQHGRVELQGGNLIYLPNANYTGPDSYTFKATDGTLESPLYTYTLTVLPVNDLPSAYGQSLTTYDNQPLAITLTGSDIETAPLTFRITSGPAVGTLSGTPPNVTYTPPLPFAGNTSFTFEVEDAEGAKAQAIVAISILASDRPPVAVAGADQSVVAGTDCLATVAVDGSASSDADGDALGYSWQLFLNGEVVDTATGQAAVSWSLPHGTYEAVLTVSTDKNGTLVSHTDSLVLEVLPSAPALAALNPAGAYANGPAFTLTLTGGCFLPGAVVQWNGTPRTTTVVSSSELTASIPASDLQTGVDIAVASLTVINGDGQVSNPLGFSLVAQTVGTADAAVTPPGTTSTVSTAPSTAGDPGVSVTVQNNGDQPVTVLAATYDTRPVGETAFQVDNGSFVDVQVTGADENVAATVFFYYPSSTTGGMENRVKLRYFDGANWIPVLSSGGLPPAKDTTDNLDGTVSGGRFAVVFDATSTPTIMALTGTVFGMIESEPQLGAITGPTGPVALGNEVSLTANFAVVGNPADAAVRFLWDDGTEAIVAPTTPTSATATHRYAAPGVYGVTVQVTDGQGDAREGRFEYVVIYDPNGGFVTGGGWIDSLPGAYLFDPTLIGKATFGFTSRYQRGQSVPTGQTQFQFQAGDFKFHSTAYEWLVVAGAKAQYKGVGQVNGAGDYGFLLTATDGQLTGGGGSDRFRLKIWDRAGGSVVYDNRRGANDDLDNADPQSIGGGSIVIQKAK